MLDKIQIRSIFGVIIFDFEKEYNTLKGTIDEVIKRSANLSSSNLRFADLRSADLCSAKNKKEELC